MRRAPPSLRPRGFCVYVDELFGSLDGCCVWVCFWVVVGVDVGEDADEWAVVELEAAAAVVSCGAL